MKTRKITLLLLASAALSLTATACNKTDSSANANVNSAPGKNGGPAPGAPSTASSTPSTAAKRFVGTWTEEGEKNDKGTQFTEDGKIIELSSNKQVGTYTTSGSDKATITMTEGGGAAAATLESDTRMKMVVGGETAYLTKK
ncbi:MAG: hypothetical protein ACJ741_13505 [Pyrinomonadaceae bacterium]